MATRRILILVFPGFQNLDAMGPLEVFAAARDAEGRPLYRIELWAEAAGPITTSSGLQVLVEHGFGAMPPVCDTLIVAGGRGTEDACRNRRLTDWIAATAGRARRVASVCTGALLLAASGLLAGRRAVTHWNWCGTLAALHPDVTVETDPIFVQDGPVWTSAGVTAGMDLSLALVEADCGRDTALAIARDFVMYMKRPGGQTQFSATLAAQATGPGRIGETQAFILGHLAADLSVAALSRRAGMSPRNFARSFQRDAGTTPAEFVEQARIDAARRLLEDEPGRSVEAIAAACGFSQADVLRRAFQRRTGISPGDYRDRFRSTTNP